MGAGRNRDPHEQGSEAEQSMREPGTMGSESLKGKQFRTWDAGVRMLRNEWAEGMEILQLTAEKPLHCTGTLLGRHHNNSKGSEDCGCSFSESSFNQE